MLQPVTISTLCDLRDDGMEALLWCNCCLRHGTIDLEAVAAKAGLD